MIDIDALVRRLDLDQKIAQLQGMMIFDLLDRSGEAAPALDMRRIAEVRPHGTGHVSMTWMLSPSLDEFIRLIAELQEQVRATAPFGIGALVHGEGINGFMHAEGVPPEAPHLFRCGDTWYLLIAEGGTERGHAVSIARGPSPSGPWDGCPANPIISHRSTSHPIQNTGHADLVEAADGSWWMVLLGVRPRGKTPMFHVLGRETFLVPVEWVDGWPVVADLELAMPTVPPGAGRPTATLTRDDFDGPSLAPAWVSVRAPLDVATSLAERAGWLRLHGSSDDLDGEYPAFAGRRQQHHRCRVRTLVDPGTAGEAGLAVRMDEIAHYEVFVREGEVCVRARIGPVSSIVAAAPAPPMPAVLRVETRDGDNHAPDLVVLGYETADGTFEELASLDGRYLSTEVASGFIGRVIGVYAVDGTASFDWFDYDVMEV